MRFSFFLLFCLILILSAKTGELVQIIIIIIRTEPIIIVQLEIMHSSLKFIYYQVALKFHAKTMVVAVMQGQVCWVHASVMKEELAHIVKKVKCDVEIGMQHSMILFFILYSR